MNRVFKDLRSYVLWLDEKKVLRRIDDKLSPLLEIPAVLRRIMYAGGPPVFFENLNGFPGWRMIGNLFYSVEVFKQLLGVKRIEDFWGKYLELISSQDMFTLFSSVTGLFKFRKIVPRRVSKAFFTANIVEDAPLDKIPAFKTWPCDASRYLTYPLVITRDPIKNVMNMGVYRFMILNGDKGVVHWQVHKRGARAYKYYDNGKMPIAIVIGSDPATLLTGAAPVPYPIDKYLFASMLRGDGLELYELPNGISVPANAEVVLEGYVLMNELSDEGPFGDHFGYCDKPLEKYPVVHVSRLYHRDNPIYYGSVTGQPPLEDSVIGKIIERLFLPIIKIVLPEVHDMNFPVHGCFQGLMIVSIKKRFPGHAKKVMNAFWGLWQTSLTKIIIVVDSDVNIHDVNQVLWAVSSNVEPGRDVLVLPNTHTDALDPSSTAPSYGGKLGIDATRKFPEENNGRPWPELVEEDSVSRKLADDIVRRILG